MTEITPDEIDDIVKSMQSEKKPQQQNLPFPPLDTPSKVSKVHFSSLANEKPQLKHRSLSDKEWAEWQKLKVKITADFGSTFLNLEQIAALEKDTVIPLDQKVEEPVDIYVDGKKVGRGEIVVVDGHFAIKILKI